MSRIRILVVGCGYMGAAHARAYHALQEFEIVGLVSRGGDTRSLLAQELARNFGSGESRPIPQFENYAQALAETRPEAVSINTYSDTHVEFALMALESGAHVFVEKPLGKNLMQAQKVFATAAFHKRQVVVGYLLQHHPAYRRFVAEAKTLGKPLVMRMNLNQYSAGEHWQRQRRLMQSFSPLLDGGVHYFDLMQEIVGTKPLRVQAMGVRLAEGLEAPNYAQVQIAYADGSLGWFEAGWGPMIDTGNPPLREAWGPEGSVRLLPPTKDSQNRPPQTHAKTRVTVQKVPLSTQNQEMPVREIWEIPEEPTRQHLCECEQAFFLKAIRENTDLRAHQAQALATLRLALAAEESLRTGRPVDLE